MKSNYFAGPCQIIKGVFAAVAIVLFFLSSMGVGAQTAFSEGEDLFRRNKPAEALPKLEAAVRDDPSNVHASLYLGLAYYQLDRLDEAIQTLRRILPKAGAEQALIASHIGDIYFRKGAATFAEQYYTQAIQGDPSYAVAYLNRANARVRAGSLKDASSDYRTYLSLEPDSPKRPDIERLLSLIGESFAAEERKQAAAAEAARAEEEKRQRLLDEVSSSLQAAAEETKGLSAGSEDVMQYSGEFELE